MSDRQRRLLAAHLYLVCDDQPDEFLEAALRGGVDVVQLRIKNASEERISSAAQRFARACAEQGALFIINDRPDLARAVGADGAHIGQDDMPASKARRLVGSELLLGLSTHTPDQIDRASGLPVDYIGVGPVHETPTKPGRPAVGLELVRYAASRATVPFFTIGGITRENAAAVWDAGGERIAVLRALTDAADPELAARDLRRSIAPRMESGVGAP
ncbi:MAG: thiamine phosphate synthase [Solirubrobacteraceae bacterium]